jgi:hypothetical protein
MINENVGDASTTPTPEALVDASLSTYRAAREGRPVPSALVLKDESVADGSELGETAAVDGPAEPLTEQGAKPDSAPGGEEADAEPKKKGGWQRTIEKQKRTIDELQQKLAGKAPAVPDAPAATPPAGPVFEKPKPRLADFEDVETYTEAMADWKFEKRTFDTRAEESRAAAERENQKRVSDWTSRKAEFVAEHADYDDVMAAVASIPLSGAQQFVILDSEFGPQVAYALAQDPAKLQQLVKLEPLAFARAIGKLETQFASQAADDGDEPASEPATPISRAPRPHKPLGAGKGVAASTFDVASRPLADYRQARESGKLR